MSLKIAVPDLISNSYFPVEAAVELGFFKDEGIEMELELIFPVDKSYEALRDGKTDFVAGSAHSALAAFPEWKGVKLLCAQAQGMYWFLVMRSDLNPQKGNLEVVKGRRIGAAPWVEMGLRGLLEARGIDIKRDDVQIAPVPGASAGNVNFGVTAAKALAEGKIDGFWANGMGAEVAVKSGAGKTVLDVRRDTESAEAFHYTLASVATTDTLIRQSPEIAAGVIRAIMKTQRALKENPALATQVGKKLFPSSEADLIADIIKRDLPYYDAVISEQTVAGMNAFCRNIGILQGYPSYTDVVAPEFLPLWAQ